MILDPTTTIMILVKISKISIKNIQKILESAQSTKVEFKVSSNFPAGLYGYALVSTNNIVSKARMVNDILI